MYLERRNKYMTGNNGYTSNMSMPPTQQHTLPSTLL